MSCTARLRRCSGDARRKGIRVERRLVRKRQNFAGLRRHDHHGAAGGAILRDGVAQLALGDVLQVLVDRQLDGRARGRRPLESAERAAARVGLIQQLAERAADLAVVGRLDAGEPFVVDADETQQLGRKLLLRIEPAVFLDESDAVEIELGDSRRLRRRHAPADVDKRALLPQAAGERLLLLRTRSRSARRRASTPCRRRSRFRWERRTPNRRRRCRRARGRVGRECRRAWRRYPSSARTGFRRAPEAPSCLCTCRYSSRA